MMEKLERLILLKRINPLEFEIHKGSINQAHNLILTTKDHDFAKRLVDGFNINVPCETNKELDNAIRRVLYQNSSDDSECMRIKFEKIDDVVSLICKIKSKNENKSKKKSKKK